MTPECVRVRRVFTTLCLFLIKAQEEQPLSSKVSKQKGREKTDQARESQKDKRRTAFNRKGLPGPAPGTIALLSDLDLNNFSAQSSQEKFTRWAAEQPREGNAEGPHGGVAVTTPDGNRAVPLRGPTVHHA